MHSCPKPCPAHKPQNCSPPQVLLFGWQGEGEEPASAEPGEEQGEGEGQEEGEGQGEEEVPASAELGEEPASAELGEEPASAEPGEEGHWMK